MIESSKTTTSIPNTFRNAYLISEHTPCQREIDYIHKILDSIYGSTFYCVNHGESPSVVTRNECRTDLCYRFAHRFHLFDGNSAHSDYFGVVHLRAFKNGDNDRLIAEAFLKPPDHYSSKNWHIPLLNYYSTFLGLLPFLCTPYSMQNPKLGSFCTQSSIFTCLLMMTRFGGHVSGPLDISATCLLRDIPWFTFQKKDIFRQIRRNGEFAHLPENFFTIDGLYTEEIAAFFQSDLTELSSVNEKWTNETIFASPKKSEALRTLLTRIVFALQSYLDSGLPVILTYNYDKYNNIQKQKDPSIQAISPDSNWHAVTLIGYKTQNGEPLCPTHFLYHDSLEGPYRESSASKLLSCCFKPIANSKNKYDQFMRFVVPLPKECRIGIKEILDLYTKRNWLKDFVPDLSKYRENILLIRSDQLIAKFFHRYAGNLNASDGSYMEELLLNLVMPEYVWVQYWIDSKHERLLFFIVYDSRLEYSLKETSIKTQLEIIKKNPIRRIALIDCTINDQVRILEPVMNFCERLDYRGSYWKPMRRASTASTTQNGREDPDHASDNDTSVSESTFEKTAQNVDLAEGKMVDEYPWISVITSCLPDRSIKDILGELPYYVQYAELYVPRLYDIETIEEFHPLLENYRQSGSDIHLLRYCRDEQITKLAEYYKNQLAAADELRKKLYTGENCLRPIECIGLATFLPEIAEENKRELIVSSFDNLVYLASLMKCKFIEIVCGSQLEQQYVNNQKIIKHSTPTEKLLNIVKILTEVITKNEKYFNGPDSQLFFAIEVEPGPFYNLNSPATIDYLYKVVTESENPLVRERIKLNLDIGHMIMLSVSRERLSVDFFRNEKPYLLSFLGHAHLSDNAWGHFADLVPGTFHRIDREHGKEMTEWLDLYFDAAQEARNNRSIFSHTISVELEAAMSMQWVHRSCRKLFYAINQKRNLCQ